MDQGYGDEDPNSPSWKPSPVRGQEVECHHSRDDQQKGYETEQRGREACDLQNISDLRHRLVMPCVFANFEAGSKPLG